MSQCRLRSLKNQFLFQSVSFTITNRWQELAWQWKDRKFQVSHCFFVHKQTFLCTKIHEKTNMSSMFTFISRLIITILELTECYMFMFHVVWGVKCYWFHNKTKHKVMPCSHSTDLCSLHMTFTLSKLKKPNLAHYCFHACYDHALTQT